MRWRWRFDRVEKVSAQESQEDQMSRRLFDSGFGCLLRIFNLSRTKIIRREKTVAGDAPEVGLLVIRDAIEEVIATFLQFRDTSKTWGSGVAGLTI